MASASILHVGDDVCHRIPVMRHAGLFVVQSEPSIEAIEKAFAQGQPFSGIAFHNAIRPASEVVVSAAKSLSTARLILFRSPYVSCDERNFDLVIPAHTLPTDWLASLRRAIEEARNLREISAQLRQESREVRSESERLRAACVRTRELILNPEFLRRDENENR